MVLTATYAVKMEHEHLTAFNQRLTCVYLPRGARRSALVGSARRTIPPHSPTAPRKAALCLPLTPDTHSAVLSAAVTGLSGASWR